MFESGIGRPIMHQWQVENWNSDCQIHDVIPLKSAWFPFFVQIHIHSHECYFNFIHLMSPETWLSVLNAPLLYINIYVFKHNIYGSFFIFQPDVQPSDFAAELASKMGGAPHPETGRNYSYQIRFTLVVIWLFRKMTSLDFRI